MSDGRFIIELMSVFNPDGIISAKKHFEEFKDTITQKDMQDAFNGYTAAVKEFINEMSMGVSKPLIFSNSSEQTASSNPFYDREIEREELRRNAYFLTKQGRLMEYFYGSDETSQMPLDADPETDYRQRRLNNRSMLQAMRSDWQEYSRSISGGFIQAMSNMEYEAGNWADKWKTMANSASNSAANAIKSFLDKSSAGFMNLNMLIQNIFDSILKAFLDMIAQMLAKLAVLNIFKAAGFLSGGLLAPLLGAFETGGSVGATGPYLLHEGEYVLPSSVVAAIKSSSAPGAQENASFSAASQGSARAVFNISPVVNLNAAASDDDIKKIVKQITEATKKGVSWAVESAGVNYKVGKNVQHRTLL